MRDISDKFATLRIAVAESIVRAKPASVKAVKSKSLPKGDAMTVAKVAGVLAAKNVPQIIPYCHDIPIDFVDIGFEFCKDRIRITSMVKSIYKTGVEMEALTSVAVAALTVYDMLKMVDENIYIESIRLIEKSGGKGDFSEKFWKRINAAVIVLSDSVYKGRKRDESGSIIAERLKAEKINVKIYEIMPDDKEKIRGRLIELCDKERIDLVITTGGTGLSKRDNTPEATLDVIEREIPGIPEIIRSYGRQRNPYSILSRAVAGIRGNTIIINLPGSKRGVEESLNIITPVIIHSFKMLYGEGH
ncbi:MAG: bifunctional molybdenum cofactor biosynthesis protein MoaC/MoaB [Deltaproteobacteria bacterium]|nr:bifunctional molybdenum cofactor biosynthesis protein MoaC/MoaB [Deltaproteobacteria bacterium]